MKAIVAGMAVAVLSASATAQVSGFVQVRAVQRTGSLERCLPAGCSTMVEEGLAELLVEHRFDPAWAASFRAEASFDAASRARTLGIREGSVGWQASPELDVRMGRQVITWGVSEYLYANDLFPKNYDVFFTGGSFDRFKGQVDGAQLKWHGALDAELVVSRPKTDRMPSALRFAAAVPAANAQRAGSPSGGKVDVAFKASATVAGWDVAAYAASMRSREVRYAIGPLGLQADAPRLRHLGASATGNAGGGVVWVEAAVRSVDGDADRIADRQFLGSSAKVIAGYSREVASDVTASAQLQVESALERGRYVSSLAPGVRPAPALSTVLHLRVAGHWVNQTVGAGAQLFAGAEGDAHFNPFASWSPVDGWTLEAGANIFRGRPDTRFGALRRDSNAYASARYSF